MDRKITLKSVCANPRTVFRTAPPSHACSRHIPATPKFRSTAAAQRVTEFKWTKIRKPRLCLGYHGSPVLNIAEFDPKFSRNTNRYGPGIYFYEDRTLAESHADSIRHGRIKYDKTPRPARVYTALIDLRRGFNIERVFRLDEINNIVNAAKALKPGRLCPLPNRISGEDFYDRLTAMFAAEADKVSLSRGVQGEITAKAQVNKLLLDCGYTSIIGKIPDPDTRLWHRAYISLMPIKPIQ